MAGMAPNQAFVVASRDQLRALRGGDGLRTSTAAFLRAPASAGPDLRAAIERAVPDADVASRAERIASIENSPMTRGLVAGVAAAAFVAFAYAALAVSAALALAGAVAGHRGRPPPDPRPVAPRGARPGHRRARPDDHRRVRRRASRSGLGLFALLRDGLGLASLVGAPIVVDVGIDPVQLGAVLLAIVAIVALGIGLGAALQRGAAPVAAVRRGFE